MPPNSRVCDRCIRKKVKCDLRRPCCSRCSEVSYPCTYSRERRRPGPPRGTRVRAGASSDAKSDPIQSLGSNTHANNPQGVVVNTPYPTETSLLRGENTPGCLSTSLNELGPGLLPYLSATVPTFSQTSFPGYYLDPVQEKEILLRFFDDVHPAIPLFHRGMFLKLYEGGVARCELVVAMVAVTAKILGPISFWRSEDVNMCMNSLLMGTAHDLDSSSSHSTLDHFRQECLMAYYEFHQFPGPQAWLKISRLTRKAYAMGLNQIDNPELCSAYDPELATEDEIESWRYVWWCVYCLDSYSNMSLGTPFVIDMEIIGTALTRRSFVDEEVPCSPKLFLSDDMDQLWRTAQDVMLNPGEREFNMHILTTTILRQAGNVLRLRIAGKQVRYKVEALKNTLTSFRLALPSRYLDPKRNVLEAESDTQHCIRMTNILHLQMTRFVISWPQDFNANESEWLDNWHQSLEACLDVFSIIEQWDSRFSSCANPAICIIVFVALRVTNLHRSCITDASSPLSTKLSRIENILLLFLEHFSSMWALPGILIKLFKYSSTDEVLTYPDVDRIMNRLKTPLHPKTLQYVHTIDPTPINLLGGFNMAMDFANPWLLSTDSPGL